MWITTRDLYFLSLFANDEACLREIERKFKMSPQAGRFFQIFLAAFQNAYPNDGLFCRLLATTKWVTQLHALQRNGTERLSRKSVTSVTFFFCENSVFAYFQMCFSRNSEIEWKAPKISHQQISGCFVYLALENAFLEMLEFSPAILKIPVVDSSLYKESVFPGSHPSQELAFAS